MTGGWDYDRASFGLFVHAYRTREGLSISGAVTASGIAAASFSRAENRKVVSAGNFLALCLFIGANPFWFLLDPSTGKRVANPPEADPGPAPVKQKRGKGRVPRETPSETV